MSPILMILPLSAGSNIIFLSTHVFSASLLAVMMSCSPPSTPLGLASTSSATTVPPASRRPFTFTSYPRGIAAMLATLAPLSLTFEPATIRWPSTIRVSPFTNSA
jgi:hypothetical protein